MAWELLETVSDSNAVRDAEISPDGEWLVFGTEGNELVIYSTGDWVHQHTYSIRGMAFGISISSDSSQIAVASGETGSGDFEVYELGGGWTEIYSESTSSPPLDVDFSPNGDWAAYVYGSGTKVLNTSDWSNVTTVTTDNSRGVGFSSDSGWLAVGTNNDETLVFSTSDWAEINDSPLTDPVEAVTPTKFDPADEYLASGSWSSSNHIYNTSDWTESSASPITDASRQIEDVAFDAHSLWFAFASRDQTCRVYSITDGWALETTLDDPTDYAWGIDFQDEYLALAADTSVYIYDVPEPDFTPTNVSVDATRDTEIDLSWTVTGGEDEVRVYRDSSPGLDVSTLNPIATLATGTESYTDTGLDNGTDYYYKIAAYSSDTEDVSDEVSGQTTLPDVTNVSASGGSRTVDISWTANHNTGQTRVEIREAGGTWTHLTTVDYTTTSASVAGLLDGTDYEVLVRAETTDVDGSRVTDTATTTLPQIGTFEIDESVRDDLTADWSDLLNTGQYRLRWKDADASSFDAADEAVVAHDAATLEYAISGLLDGTDYDVKLRTETDDVAGDWHRETATTLLPAIDAFSLDASVQDELIVGGIDPVIDTGQYRIRWKRSEDGTYVAENETTLAHDVDPLEYTISPVLDGEKYDVGIQPETDDATGDWHTATEITKLVSADGLAFSNVTDRGLTLSWTDNSGFDGSYQVWRRRTDYEYDDPKGELIATLADTATEFVEETTLHPGREYAYTVRATTQYVHADSSEATATTDSIGLEQRAVPPRGWYVEVDHPSGTVLRPSVLDGPERRPRANDQPRVRIPVPKTDRWFSEALEDETTMRVWVDGNRLPIGVFKRAERQSGQAVLVGIGGTELETRVEHEVDQQATHELVEELVSANTDLTPNVDAPESTLQEGVEMLAVDTTSEILGAIEEIDETTPATVENDSIKLYQTAWTTEAEDATADSSTIFDPSTHDPDGEFSGGDGLRLNDSSHDAEYEFTTNHTIPEGDLGVDFRLDITAEDVPQSRWTLEDSSGTVLTQTDENGLGISGLRWDDVSFYGNWNPPELEPGTYTVRFDCTTTAAPSYLLDVVCPRDTRFDVTLGDSIHETGGYLDGPETMPDAVDVLFDAIETPFSIVSGTADLTIDNTGGEQAIAMSNDFGATWLEESNTSSATVDFADPGGALTLRLTLSRYGQRDTATPRTGYQGQTVDTVTLSADVDETPLTIDQTFDDSLLSILQELADRGDFLFEVQTDGDTQTLEWTQPGQRSSERDLAISDLELAKEKRIYQRVTVKGSNREVSGERFTASNDFVSLANTRLINGSETVYDDDGTQFDRGTDYQIQSRDGTIRQLSGGNLVEGDTYRVDYEFEVQGSFADDDVSEPRELVEDIPALTSVRACEQAAFALYQTLSSPRWEGTIQLPRDEVGFQVVDALSFDEAPDQALPLEIHDITHTPGSIELSVGQTRSVQDAVDEIRNRIGAVSRLV